MAFVDTNVLVYAVDPSVAADKHRVAVDLLRREMVQRSLTLSTQVLQEFYATVLRRKLLPPDLAVEALRLWAEHDVVPVTPDLLFRGFELQQRLQISVWDALVVQAALDAGCTTLYTEDLQDGMQVGPLRVMNPFKAGAVQEPRPGYATAPGRRRGTHEVALRAQSPEQVDRLLRQAIRGKRLVRFRYDGLERVGEPHDYGLLNGKGMLNFFQTAGESRSRRTTPWRTYEVRKMSDLEVLGSRFSGTRKTEAGEHKAWEEVYASVTLRALTR